MAKADHLVRSMGSCTTPHGSSTKVVTMLTLPDFAQPVLASVRPGLLPSHLPTLPRPAPRRRPDHRPPHRLQPAPHRRRLGPRRCLQLSPRPLQTALVHSRLGAHPGPLHPRSLGPRGARLPGRRRYRRRAPRRQGLRQGLSPRPGALDPFLHRLPLGAQMGRPGDPGPVPLRHPGLGAAGPDGVVSQPGEGRESRGPGRQAPAKKAKDKTKVQAKERARRKASRAKTKAPKKMTKSQVRRRHKTPSELMRQLLSVLTHWFPDRQFVFAGDGGYGTHALARFAARRRRRDLTLGEPVLRQRGPARAAAGGRGQEERPPAQEGGQAAHPRGGRGRGRASASGSRCPGTAAAVAPSRWSAGRATGTSRERGWSRCSGCSCTT